MPRQIRIFLASTRSRASPTIKYFPKGKKDAPEDYDGGVQRTQLWKWVNDKIGTSRKVKKAPTAAKALDVDTFDKEVLGEKGALVESLPLVWPLQEAGT